MHSINRHAPAILAALACGIAPTSVAAKTTQPSPYYKTIQQLHAELVAGKTTSVDLTQEFIHRIKALNHDGPHLNAVIRLNPSAITIARERDEARKAGNAHGLLFGIPFMVKANMDTAGMPTTAGSMALAGSSTARNATIVSKLEASGAILLGKTNLSEWANFRSSHSTSGWSAVGGLTRNPYVLTRNACGSSSGSAVAVSAGLIPFALGTETDGSLTCPASVNGIVDIKPTLGLVSRAGIIPVSLEQDDPGPMTRTVAGAAAVLTAIAGSDPRDKFTASASRHATNYTQFLDPNGLKGKRIGLVCAMIPDRPEVRRMVQQDVTAMRAAGAIVIPATIPHLNKYSRDEMTVLLYSFKHDINAYLGARKGLTVKNLAGLISFNHTHPSEEMPWFRQNLFIAAQKSGSLESSTYKESLAREKLLAGPDGIDAALLAQHLSALMNPASGPAWTTDLINGDHTAGGGDGPAAVAGYPSITVPAGNVHGLPVGMVFYSGKWTEPTLIEIADGFEHATEARIRPRFLTRTPTIATVPTVASDRARAPVSANLAPPICQPNGPNKI